MLRAALLAALAVLTIAAPADAAEWLAGDLHVHTCASHDVWCGPDDGDEPWTLGLSVSSRFAEASVRGLDYLAITDHNDTSSASDPGFGSSGVLGIPGYENSVRGHAQVLGTDTVLDNGDGSAAAIDALRDEIRARGGILQANHPGYDQTTAYPGCDSSEGLHWQYGTAVDVDSVEVLNPTSPASTAERLLDCLIAKGFTPAVTGGSDSHWATTVAVQGVGNPTTWVLSKQRAPAAILAAIRDGRTAVSKQPPVQGGAPVVIERLRKGAWEPALGETVAPGTPLRVRSPMAGFVTVRGTAIADQPVAPGGSIDFRATQPVRAIVRSAPEADVEGCETTGSPISTCASDQAILALTSPVFVGAT